MVEQGSICELIFSVITCTTCDLRLLAGAAKNITDTEAETWVSPVSPLLHEQLQGYGSLCVDWAAAEVGGLDVPIFGHL